MPFPPSRSFDLGLAALAGLCVAVEGWRMRRGDGSGWWLVAYVAFAGVFLAFASRSG